MRNERDDERRDGGNRGEERDTVSRQAATLRVRLMLTAPILAANFLSVFDRFVQQAKHVRFLWLAELDRIGFGEVGDGEDVRLRITASVCQSVGLCTYSV